MAFSSTGSASLLSEKLFTDSPARSQTSLHTDASLRENAAGHGWTANAKLVFGISVLGGVMKEGFKTSLLEKVPVLILLGILAGAIGGLGIGVIQMKTLSSSSAGK